MRQPSLPPPAFGREEAQALTGLIVLFTVTAAWWALAFWQVNEAPVWLSRTRYVCFGVNDTGLPDGGGWIALIGGPLGMLLILVVGWQEGIRRLVEHARTAPPLAIVLGALGLGSILLVAGAATRVHQARAEVADLEPAPRGMNVRRLDQQTPPLALTSQAGNITDIAALRGQPALVTFAYAHCTTVCPLIVMQAVKAQSMLRDTGNEPVLLVVTLDPWRDTPSRLPSIAKAWGLSADNAYVLSGTVAQVEAALDAWKVPRTRDLQTGEVVHPSLVYVIDRQGRLAYATSGGVDAIVALVGRL